LAPLVTEYVLLAVTVVLLTRFPSEPPSLPIAASWACCDEAASFPSFPALYDEIVMGNFR
jgi:hypothetical protein